MKKAAIILVVVGLVFFGLVKIGEKNMPPESFSCEESWISLEVDAEITLYKCEFTTVACLTATVEEEPGLITCTGEDGEKYNLAILSN